jgi:hypothetical protein
MKLKEWEVDVVKDLLRDGIREAGDNGDNPNFLVDLLAQLKLLSKGNKITLELDSE